MAEYLRFDSPIRNLQVFLRTISGVYTEIPSVIPDGVYGNSTKEAVKAFQNRFSLNETGITDNSTWDAILRVYREIEKDTSQPNWVRIFPEEGLKSDNNSYGICYSDHAICSFRTFFKYPDTVIKWNYR